MSGLFAAQKRNKYCLFVVGVLPERLAARRVRGSVVIKKEVILNLFQDLPYGLFVVAV